MSKPGTNERLEAQASILEAWRWMYTQWEAHQAPSPSANDLYQAAVKVDPDSFAWEIVADLIFELMCQGLEDEEVITRIYRISDILLEETAS